MQNKRTERLTELQELLTVCPADVLTRCHLALLLEELDLPNEALLNWKRVLALDPNNLQAREGVNRCRESGPDCRSFHSQM